MLHIRRAAAALPRQCAASVLTFQLRNSDDDVIQGISGVDPDLVAAKAAEVQDAVESLNRGLIASSLIHAGDSA